MQKLHWLCCGLMLCSMCASAQTQALLTWEQVRLRF